MQVVHVVAPDEGIRDALKTFLESFNIPVRLFSDAYEFLGGIDASADGCVVVEAELEGLNGLGLLAQLRASGNTMPLFLLVNTATPEFTRHARISGVRGIFKKPLVNDDIAVQLGSLFTDAWSGLSAAYARTETLVDGTDITVRTIQPGDRDIERDFVRNLSPRSRYHRFFGGLKDLPESLLYRFTHMHYPDHVAFIATVTIDGKEREIGVARYLQTADEQAEFAVVVADAWQQRGVATLLLKHLLKCAKNAGIHVVEGSVLRENQDMLNFARHFGFTVEVDPDDACTAHLTLVLNDNKPGPDN